MSLISDVLNVLSMPQDASLAPLALLFPPLFSHFMSDARDMEKGNVPHVPGSRKKRLCWRGIDLSMVCRFIDGLLCFVLAKGCKRRKSGKKRGKAQKSAEKRKGNGAYCNIHLLFSFNVPADHIKGDRGKRDRDNKDHDDLDRDKRDHDKTDHDKTDHNQLDHGEMDTDKRDHVSRLKGSR